MKKFSHHNISNWLKNLVKEAEVACVFAGLPEAEEVLLANPQLGRLFGDPYVLSPFDWKPDQPQTATEFRTFLKTLEDMLLLPQTMPLTDIEMAWRCYVATEGNMAYLMNLIRRAAHYAVLREHPALDMSLLAEAFDNRLAGKRRGISNPFVGNLPPIPKLKGGKL